MNKSIAQDLVKQFHNEQFDLILTKIEEYAKSGFNSYRVEDLSKDNLNKLSGLGFNITREFKQEEHFDDYVTIISWE